jgi:hypothetical protein
MSGLVINIRDQYAIQNHLVTFVKRSVITSVAHFASSGCGLRRRLPEPDGGNSPREADGSRDALLLIAITADRLRSRLLP